jgi:hypothetical protein
VAPELSLQRLLLQLAHLDTLQHEVTGQRLTLESPELLLHRTQDGQLDLLRMVQQWPQAHSPAQQPPPLITVITTAASR